MTSEIFSKALQAVEDAGKPQNDNRPPMSPLGATLFTMMNEMTAAQAEVWRANRPTEH